MPSAGPSLTQAAPPSANPRMPGPGRPSPDVADDPCTEVDLLYASQVICFRLRPKYSKEQRAFQRVILLFPGQVVAEPAYRRQQNVTMCVATRGRGDGGDVSPPVRNSGGMSPQKWELIKKILAYLSKFSDFPIFPK